MTDVLERVRTSAAAPARADRLSTLGVRGALAAAWAASVGVASLTVLALVIWAADSQSGSSAGGAMRFAVQMWLLAQRVPLRVPGGSLAIPPLGLTLLIGLLVARGAAILARSLRIDDLAGVGAVTAAVTIPYAVIATVLATVAQGSGLRPSIAASFVTSAVVGALASAVGAARGTGRCRAGWKALPIRTRLAARAAAAAGAVVLGAATLLTAVSLIGHAHRVGSLAGSYDSAPGEFTVVLLCVLLLPNAVLFAGAYAVGPGFAVGTGTSVSLAGSHLGAVPAFPLLGALPSGGAGWPVLLVCVLATILTGVAAAWRVAWSPDGKELAVADQVRVVLAAGAGLAVALAALAGFSGGPAGPGRLAAVGASPWQVGLVAGGETAVIAAVVVLASAWTGLARQSLRRPAG